jgi:hypothetical protein
MRLSNPTDLLKILAVGMSLLAVGLVVLMALSRVFYLRRGKKKDAFEQKIKPLALGLISGDKIPLLRGDDAEALAGILLRYRSNLEGDGSEIISRYFERSGGVSEEIKKTSSRRKWRRVAGCYYLGLMGSRQGIPALLTALEDKADEVRATATRSLALLKAPEAIEPLALALEHNLLPRAIVSSALLEIGISASLPLQKLLSSPSDEMRGLAAEMLGYLDDSSSVSQVAALLKDPSALVRISAAKSLVRTADQNALDLLRLSLTDRIAGVRAEVAKALSVVGDRESLPLLLAEATSSNAISARPAAQAAVSLDIEEVEKVIGQLNNSEYLEEALDRAKVRRG